MTTGIFKAMVADLKETQKSDVQFDDVSDDDGMNIEEENWKNQNVDAKKKKKAVGRLQRNIHSILNPEQDAYTSIPLLLNGGKSNKCDDIPSIYSSSTCGPDAFFHLFSACYVDCAHFKEIIDKDESILAKFIRLHTSPEATEEQILAFRNWLLLKLFPETVIDIGSVISIDCDSRISDVYSKICEMCPSLYSTQVSAECCEEIVENEFIKFDLHGFNVKNVQQSIHPMDFRYHCKSCKRSSQATYHSQFIVAFDCENADKDVSLNDIQREIKIGALPYILFGIVEGRPNHYLAHVLRHTSNSSQWVEYDDVKYRPRKHNNFIANRAVILLYRLNTDPQIDQQQISQLGSSNENPDENETARIEQKSMDDTDESPRCKRIKIENSKSKNATELDGNTKTKSVARDDGSIQPGMRLRKKAPRKSK